MLKILKRLILKTHFNFINCQEFKKIKLMSCKNSQKKQNRKKKEKRKKKLKENSKNLKIPLELKLNKTNKFKKKN